MKFMASLWAEACWRRERKVFSANGQPQCLRKPTTVGFPFFAGMGRRSDEGALDPISGAGDVVSDVGDIQDASSCWNVISNSSRFSCVRLSCFRRLVM